MHTKTYIKNLSLTINSLSLLKLPKNKRMYVCVCVCVCYYLNDKGQGCGQVVIVTQDIGKTGKDWFRGKRQTITE